MFLFYVQGWSQNFQPLSLSLSGTLKFKIIKVLFLLHTQVSELETLISLDWLQVMLSGRQEIIKINVSSKAFFEITESESKCKVMLFLF